MAEATYSLSISLVMLHPTTKAPLIETGKEAKTEIYGGMIPRDPAKAEELFLALVHAGAEALWNREVKPLWVPSAETAPTSSKPSSTP